jgi:hypothetical protein
MATETECPFYNKCGFVAWRKDRPDGHMNPLPANGDCGKEVDKCGRANPQVPVEVEIYGPAFDSEQKLVFPKIPNNNNRPPRRLVGGGHR